ncbi:class I mannose-6-phosphate isomerase [Micromonospora chalcea]|uniref:Mannose-6-phosphate isomerase n=1 Tax=Micromonospora globbae TaxID=1894969 RepID=A0A420EKU3_9ACTN|nr:MULTISPECIES: class I mannose-6-phosphate isomerase [Micromonospora]MBC8989613.1 mannose-6-phosphate isomerase [Micromonospora chalcea]RKF21303.1 mannose-6-phosphate isomerase [Micromonospora globbae]
MSGPSADWYPLCLTAPARPLVTGGRAIAERLGRTGLPDWPIAETWEVSDVDGYQAQVTNGPLAGCQLRELVQRHPEALLGRGWRGPRFPVLTKFIDASGGLPVHLHADDATARRLEGQRNGKTEAWHILHAAPGATALCGIREGVSREALHEALLAQDFDAVMRRLPVRAGDTIYVPGGTLHSFGPDTLVYEIEQTSNIQQHAMRWHMEDGSPVPDEQWHTNLTMLLQEVKLDPKPEFTPGLRVPVDDAVDRVFLCAGPYFALERWRAGDVAPIRHTFDTAQILSNVGGPVRVHVDGWSQILEPAATLLLPAACGSAQIDGPADVLFGYLPDLDADVFRPLLAAGYRPQTIASLGEGFDELVVEAVTASPANITPS